MPFTIIIEDYLVFVMLVITSPSAFCENFTSFINFCFLKIHKNFLLTFEFHCYLRIIHLSINIYNMRMYLQYVRYACDVNGDVFNKITQRKPCAKPEADRVLLRIIGILFGIENTLTIT